MLERPDILIPGFPKAGTTALAMLLDGHPRIALMEPKEPHRYSWGLDPDVPAANRANALDESAYSRAILDARERGQLVIDASTSYCHPAVAQGTARRLAQACPDARVILTVRDPMKRLISDWRMRQAEGWARQHLSDEVQRNLEALCGVLGLSDPQGLIAHLPRSADWLGLERTAGHGSFTLIASGFYDALIALYREQFGDRLLVIPQEALRDQPDLVLGRCFAHLGLPLVSVTGGSSEFNVGDHRVETRLSRLMRASGIAWAARHLLPHALVVRARHAVTQSPERPIDDLATSPHANLLKQLYSLMTRDTRAQVEETFGVRWG